MITTQTMQAPDGLRQTQDGDWGYAHVDAEDLQITINLLMYYLTTLSVPNDDAEADDTANFRLMAATMRLTERLADAAATHLDSGADGALCHAYLDWLQGEEDRRATALAAQVAQKKEWAARLAPTQDQAGARASDPETAVGLKQ